MGSPFLETITIQWYETVTAFTIFNAWIASTMKKSNVDSMLKKRHVLKMLKALLVS